MAEVIFFNIVDINRTLVFEECNRCRLHAPNLIGWSSNNEYSENNAS